MATKFREGSQGAAEAKEGKIILIVFGVITLLVLLLMFVIPSDYRLFVKRAGFIPNLIGAILALGSYAVYYVTIKQERDSTWMGVLWFLLLGGGFVTAAGFNFDYFGI